MKKIVIIVLFAASTVFGYEVEDFKKGYVTAISSLNFSFQNDGVQPKKLNYIGKNVVYMDIGKLSTSEILFSQYLAHREGFRTNIVSDKLLLGAFDRLADAEETQANAKKLLNFKTSIIKNNKDEMWSRSPVTDIVLKELIIDGEYVNKEVVYTKGSVAAPTVKQVTVQEPTRTFVLRNFKAQSYTLKANSDKYESKNYNELHIMDTENFRTNQQITTNGGETFVKVQDKNIYFLLKDVEFKK